MCKWSDDCLVEREEKDASRFVRRATSSSRLLGRPFGAEKSEDEEGWDEMNGICHLLVVVGGVE